MWILSEALYLLLSVVVVRRAFTLMQLQFMVELFILQRIIFDIQSINSWPVLPTCYLWVDNLETPYKRKPLHRFIREALVIIKNKYTWQYSFWINHNLMLIFFEGSTVEVQWTMWPWDTTHCLNRPSCLLLQMCLLQCWRIFKLFRYVQRSKICFHKFAY